MVILVVLGAIGRGIFSFVSDGFKSSGPYQTYEMATERIESDPVLRERLGEPISTGWTDKVRYHETVDGGKTCLSFSVSGSKDDGIAYVEAFRENDAWEFRELVVSIKGNSALIEVVPPPDDGIETLCPDEEFQD